MCKKNVNGYYWQRFLLLPEQKSQFDSNIINLSIVSLVAYLVTVSVANVTWSDSGPSERFAAASLYSYDDYLLLDYKLKVLNKNVTIQRQDTYITNQHINSYDVNKYFNNWQIF